MFKESRTGVRQLVLPYFDAGSTAGVCSLSRGYFFFFFFFFLNKPFRGSYISESRTRVVLFGCGPCI